MIDEARLRADIGAAWRDSILGPLQEFMRIPNKSPGFEPDWERLGHMERAVTLLADWCRSRDIPGMQVNIHRLPGLTPLLVVDIPGESADCVLLYGHLDKQPEFEGWLPGLGPWEPQIRDGKLYGRGGADDGYAVFAAVAAIAALKHQQVPLPRCVILIEASEECGSPHLPAHLDALGAKLGSPGLVICLDAECGNYQQLWCTNSLRGNLLGRLSVRVLDEGAHSGLASGIAPSAWRIARQLLERVECAATGEVLLDELKTEIPADRRAQLSHAARTLGPALLEKIPFAPGVRAESEDYAELLFNNTWRATLAVLGADGIPPVTGAGNVLLPAVTLKLSLRLPPGIDPGRAAAALQRALENSPPHGAQVSFEVDSASPGWNAPSLEPWLADAVQQASRAVFGADVVHTGGGGTIPFMAMLGQRLPDAQFFITGVLGPKSNAHGPNEFLHIDYAVKLTECVARVLATGAVSEQGRAPARYPA